MAESPIIAATYVEWKMIKTRKVLQLIFETPLEQMQDVLTKLGAPKPDRDDWYGIVLLQNPLVATAESRPSETAEAPQPHSETPGGAIQTAQKNLSRSDVAERRRYAAFLRAVRDYPKNPDFRKWVFSKIGFEPVGSGEAQIAAYIQWQCGIDTRVDIKTDEAAYEKFLEMEAEFDAETPGRLAERRG